MKAGITVLTPLYLNCPERLDYFKTTVESFYRCNQYPGNIIHNVVDDRSPQFQKEAEQFCKQRGLNLIKRIDANHRRGFFDVVQALLASVETEYYIYLEPDHYFYLPYDFITPSMALFRQLPELYQIYLRAPLVYDRFQRLDDNYVVTWDLSPLRRVVIDGKNSGWVGYGKMHESFSLMPSLFRTATMRQYLEGRYFEGTPLDVEVQLAREWENKMLVGYLNCQAFCYHIGAAGKHGPGGYLNIGDRAYETAWSEKML